MMETTISDFHTSFYIPAIQNLAFHLPHVRILGKNHCGELRRTAFKQHELFQDVLCRRDYSERVVASFANKIQSGYYGGNRYVSIEGIVLGFFCAAPGLSKLFDMVGTRSNMKLSPNHTGKGITDIIYL